MNKMSSLQLAAIVMKSLPRSQAEKVAERLDASELQSLADASGTIKNVTTVDIEKTLDKLEAATRELEQLEDEADRPREPVYSEENGESPFAFLEEVAPEMCQRILADEHPRNTAIVLSFFNPERASEILKSLEAATRVSVIRRLCNNDELDRTEVAELSKTLRLRLKKLVNLSAYNEDGIGIAAKVLSCIDPQSQNDLLNYVMQSDPELAQKLEKSVFHFDDIQKLPSHSMKVLLKHVDTSLWAPSLKRAQLKTLTTVLRHMADQPATILNREIACIGRIDKHLCQHAQQQVISTVLRLMQQGKIAPLEEPSPPSRNAI